LFLKDYLLKKAHGKMHYTLIGYFTKDIAPNVSEGYVWGGTVTYSGLVAAEMNADVTVLTIGEPHPSPANVDPRVKWHIHPSAQTTTFDNRYDIVTGKRHQLMPSRAGDIPVEMVKKLADAPDIVHLAPLGNEVSSEIAAQFPNSWVVATPQGWMREVDSEYHVHKVAWQGANQMLPYLKALCLSEEDVQGDIDTVRTWAAAGPTVLYTRGPNGAILMHGGQEISIKAAPADVSDPTGAGDVIAVAFFIRYYETDDPIEAAIFGTVAASIIIEHQGISHLPSYAEIEERRKTWSREDALAL
jgi:hypothetical protein